MDTELHLPESLEEAILMFNDKLFAHRVVAAFVWPDGEPTCHHCGAKNAHFMEAYLRYRCRACRKDFTVKNGTIFEDSPLPLGKWLIAMWMIANCKNGISSYEISRALKVTQKTTWFMSHRIREADSDKSLLTQYHIDHRITSATESCSGLRSHVIDFYSLSIMDDDAWKVQFANSLDFLEAMYDEAVDEYKSGNTIKLG